MIMCHSLPRRRRLLARSLAVALFVMATGNFVHRIILILGQDNQAAVNFDGKNEKYNGRNNHRRRHHHHHRKVLYVVTSLAAVDTGKRSTMAGDDRFVHTLLPVVSASAASLAKQFIHVDVYLICHYTLNTTQEQLLRNALPETVGLTVWNNATPLGYASEEKEKGRRQVVVPITRALARQHRYVIKDLMEYYDLFINFEDDMLIHGSQAQAFVDVTQDLYDLRQAAPTSTASSSALETDNATPPLERYHGSMTKLQLSRMIPGWIRVEHVADPPPTKQHQFPQIPVTLQWPSTTRPKSAFLRQQAQATSIIRLDPAPCCSVPHTSPHVPVTTPRIEDLYFWETSLEALGLRRMPVGSRLLDWVVLQPGGDDQYLLSDMAIGEYWTGNDPNFQESAGNGNVIFPERPDRLLGNYMSNQGGWMATKRQILEWHRLWCRGSFLPPYDSPTFEADGLARMIVEYWSGGFQLAGLHACNLHRLIPLQPDLFAQFLLYHTSNNKQHQKYVRHRFYGRHILDFWGQLNTIRINAEKKILSSATTTKTSLKNTPGRCRLACCSLFVLCHSMPTNETVAIFQDQLDANAAAEDDPSLVFFELANAPTIGYRLDDNVLIRIHQNSEAQTHTGGVVWETSYLLLGYLLQQQEQMLGRIVVEVGAGCGLLGIALAVANKASERVVVTEVDQVLPLLSTNVQANQPLLSISRSSRLDVYPLDWTHFARDSAAAGMEPHSVDTIVGTDVVFSTALVEPLWQTLQYLSHHDTVIYLCLQVRCAAAHGLLLSKAADYGFDMRTLGANDEDQDALPRWAHQMECFLFCITPTQTIVDSSGGGKRRRSSTTGTKRQKKLG